MIQCAELVCRDLIWDVGLTTDDRDFISRRGMPNSNRSHWLRDGRWTVTRWPSAAPQSSAQRRHRLCSPELPPFVPQWSKFDEIGPYGIGTTRYDPFCSPCASAAHTETAQHQVAHSSVLGQQQGPLVKLWSRLHFLRRWRRLGKLSPVLVGHGAWRSDAIQRRGVAHRAWSLRQKFKGH
jgi:hypothetical protein